ncbi:helix-turn-helix domain-containing protein [Streptomyces uncialis]|uniref:helix-turn-helix domain-containing protein n=1 Tax=Streptomyces uncialis TaxID=1048205 RepID=UPI00225B4EDB|nr:helix-turn-helix domain-containing protein [Streptomyces uncialis]MCX4661085.1 helix-turn-helix domain-containing protein [Streptomyces uncialis]
MASLNVGNLGEYLRDQRRSAQLSLRQLAEAAGVSNPYLSQIERGLRKPSAEVLQQVAKALRISAETLYVRAGILDERERDELETRAVILGDPSINEQQKQVLLQIYESFRKENGTDGTGTDGSPRGAKDAIPDSAAAAPTSGQSAATGDDEPPPGGEPSRTEPDALDGTPHDEPSNRSAPGGR